MTSLNNFASLNMRVLQQVKGAKGSRRLKSSSVFENRKPTGANGGPTRSHSMLFMKHIFWMIYENSRPCLFVFRAFTV